MEIDIKDIEINKDNVRFQPNEDISKLMQSIKENGLIQPIGLSKVNSHYVIIWGHRRFLAFKKLGLKKIEAIVKNNISEKDMIIINTSENLQQKNILPHELGLICTKLMKMG